MRLENKPEKELIIIMSQSARKTNSKILFSKLKAIRKLLTIQKLLVLKEISFKQELTILPTLTILLGIYLIMRSKTKLKFLTVTYMGGSESKLLR